MNNWPRTRSPGIVQVPEPENQRLHKENQRLRSRLRLIEGQRDIQVECTGKAQIKITELKKVLKENEIVMCESCRRWCTASFDSITECDKCDKWVCHSCWTSKETHCETWDSPAEGETRCPECL